MLEFCNTDPELVVVTRMVCVTGFCFNKLCGCFGWKRKLFLVILGDKIQIISSTDFMINGVDQYFFFSSGYFTVVKKKGNFYYVVKDFHTTLESILRKLLPQEVLSAFKNAAVLHRLLLEAQSSRLLLLLPVQ